MHGICNICVSFRSVVVVCVQIRVYRQRLSPLAHLGPHFAASRCLTQCIRCVLSFFCSHLFYFFLYLLLSRCIVPRMVFHFQHEICCRYWKRPHGNTFLLLSRYFTCVVCTLCLFESSECEKLHWTGWNSTKTTNHCRSLSGVAACSFRRHLGAYFPMHRKRSK